MGRNASRLLNYVERGESANLPLLMTFVLEQASEMSRPTLSEQSQCDGDHHDEWRFECCASRAQQQGCAAFGVVAAVMMLAFQLPWFDLIESEGDKTAGTIFLGILCVMSAFAFASAWRGRVRLSPQRVEVRGVFGVSEIDWRDITEARWINSLGIDFRGQGKSVTIDTILLPLEAKWFVAQQVKQKSPLVLERGWIGFLTTHLRLPTVPECELIVLPRRRWNVIFVTALLCLGVLAVLAHFYWPLHPNRLFQGTIAAMVLASLLWPVFYLATPPEGSKVRKPDPEASRTNWMIASYFAGIPIVLGLLLWLDPPREWRLPLFNAYLVVVLVFVVRHLITIERRQAPVRAAQQQQAVEEWEARFKGEMPSS